MEDVAVTVTRGGYLKRTSVDTYRRQSRGGKGRIGMGTRTEDLVEHLIIASTHSYLLIFTNKGRVYWLKIYEIPDARHGGQGQARFGPDQPAAGRYGEGVPGGEGIRARPVHRDGARKHGVIKKCELTEFDNPMSRGIIARVAGRWRRTDRGAHLTNGKNYIFLGSHDGQAIRFDEARCAPWAGRRAACAAWIWTRATTWSAWKLSKRKA